MWGTNTEKYLWNCCTQLQRYEDAFSSGSTNMLTYDQLNRLTSMTDTQGNQVQYEYDSMGRVLTITPAQGSNYRTEYTYNANGSLNDLTIYVGGTGETTSYTYDTTSGKLLQRDMPVVSSNHIRTAYSYDSAGRLEYETVTREAGGTTNLYKTQYAYAYIAASSGGGRTLTRTEQNYSGGWVNDYKVEYTWNALEWMRKEQRWDWALGSWVAKYDVNQEYDKRGNRTRYDKNVQGSAGDYGIAYDLSYTFDGSSLLTAITDADNGAYSASVTCDANSNITSIDEVLTGTGHTPQNNHVYTYFDVDDLNRVTAYRTKNYNGLNWMWEKRAHQYDGLGRATKSTYKNWIDGTTEPAGTSIEHVYSKDGEHLQNYDGSSTYGATWNWAGTANPMLETKHALRGPNADTASQTGYNLATNASPQERTFLNPTTEGDRRHLWGQGRPMAKDSSGSGSNWATGLKSNVQNINQQVAESRLDYSGTVSATVDRGTDAREKGRIGIFGSMLSYAGSYGRVTSEAIGRDINPLGRGDGNAYVAGWINLGDISPGLPKGIGQLGNGNSINNCLSCNHVLSSSYPDFGDIFGPRPGDPGYKVDPGFNMPMPYPARPNPGFNDWGPGGEYNPFIPNHNPTIPGGPPYIPGVDSELDKLAGTYADERQRRRARREACCNAWAEKPGANCGGSAIDGDFDCEMCGAHFAMPSIASMCINKALDGSPKACIQSGINCVLPCIPPFLLDMFGPSELSILYAILASIFTGDLDAGTFKSFQDIIIYIGKRFGDIGEEVMTKLLEGLLKFEAMAIFLKCLSCCMRAFDGCQQITNAGKCTSGGNTWDWSSCFSA